MVRESRGLENWRYDDWLAQRAGTSRSARQELEQRNVERRNAHDSDGKGYHFGLDNDVVKVESKEHFKQELDKRGLMLAHEVNKDLKGPKPHEFRGRKTR